MRTMVGLLSTLKACAAESTSSPRGIPPRWRGRGEHGRGENMATHAQHFCQHPGCSMLTSSRWCERHAALHQQDRTDSAHMSDERRGSAAQRGYDAAWHRFSRWYLSRPENQFCALHISPRCKVRAECVDHIVSLADGGAKYAYDNLQPSCLACNTLKGRRVIRGTWTFGKG